MLFAKLRQSFSRFSPIISEHFSCFFLVLDTFESHDFVCCLPCPIVFVVGIETSRYADLRSPQLDGNQGSSIYTHVVIRERSSGLSSPLRGGLESE